ncbi:acylamino-acid-releasing enzyme [Pelobates cultripes]|uniref:Acylamino-acid-releasing enzyme n=1 Tax=Pelobates cultripes TaxID=61616 RepID=A0AAD1SY39_PELCU|nr:acylamino-acid-releasing enzyme [Pelobates cultripes]
MAAEAAQPIKNIKEIVSLYRDLSHYPTLYSATVGPDVTTQYGGKYCNIYTEWTQRDLDRNEQVKFCRQYIVFHDNNTIVYSGACGNSCEIKGELLSKESLSGSLKAVLRDTTNAKGESTQFLEVWDKNCKIKSINLTSLDKHGKVYEDDQFGCLSWSHSESHLLYIAEKKRPKTESFFQIDSKNLGSGVSDGKEDAIPKPIKGDQFVFHEDWGEGLVNKSVPVLCVMDIESGNISVLDGIPEYVSPGQAFWSPDDTGVVFVGWWHSPYRLGLKYCPNRRSALFFVDLTGGKCEHKVIIVGLDNAGKTTILYQFLMNEVVHTAPTIGSNVEEIVIRNTQFLMWDIGGQETLRATWNSYYSNTEFVILVIDSTDRERLPETREELYKMLAHEELRDAAVLVFANKQDVKNSMTASEISSMLALGAIKDRAWHIQGCCALTGEGLPAGLDWLKSRVTAN